MDHKVKALQEEYSLTKLELPQVEGFHFPLLVSKIEATFKSFTAFNFTHNTEKGQRKATPSLQYNSVYKVWHKKVFLYLLILRLNIF